VKRRGTLSAPLRALLALTLVFAAGLVFHADGAFYRWDTHGAMLRQASVHGILACGMTLVIVTAGIDLAVGSVLALAAVLFSLLTIHAGWGAPAAIAAVLGAGVVLGASSGGLISIFGLQPFIVTLALMVFGRGLAKQASGGQKISQAVLRPDGSGYDYVDLPRVFELIDSRLLGGRVWLVTLVFVAIAAASWVILARLRVGRHAYAVGANPEAARLSGVPVRRTLVLVYAWSGLCAAVAGICQAAQEQQGDAETGTGYELSAIAMVVIGGTSLMGGRGGVVLTLVGVLTIGYLQKILSLNAVGEAGRLMLTGAIIVGAVLFQRSRRNG
jgi:ribose transport system permease protein